MAIVTASQTGDMTRKMAAYVHPTFALLQTMWTQLCDVREGTGGFMSGEYLVAHPREWQDHTADTPRVPTKKLKARRALACYENFAGTIVSTMQTALFREQAMRRVGEGKTETDIDRWWENVDNQENPVQIDDFMMAAWDLAATFGHMFLYMDRAKSDTVAATAADQGMPFLRGYTPLDAVDWLFNDRGVLTAIKFQELEPRPDLKTPGRQEVRYRLIDDVAWTLYDAKGKILDTGAHAMGICPVVTLYSTRRPMDPLIGLSVLGDPKLYIDLYNLTSEIRELLRSQTFGLLNIPLGTGQDRMSVEEAMQLAGGAKGTDNVLFSGIAAGYVQPDTGNVEAYHAEASRRLRTIYRQASLTWEADSKDAEAQGSLKLKREDMNQRLSGHASECERADYALAKLFYRAQYGPDGWEAKWDADEVQINYPQTFDMTPFDELVGEATAAQTLGMPARFLKEQRKMLVSKFTGMADLPPSTLNEIEQAIEDAPDDLTPAEKEQQRSQEMAKALKGGPPAVTVPRLKPGDVAA